MTQNHVKNIIGNVASSCQYNRAIEIPNISKIYIFIKFARFHLSTLGICNAYLDKRHVVGKFFLFAQIIFKSEGLIAYRNVSGKLCMKLAIIPST